MGGSDYLKAEEIYEELCQRLDKLRNVEEPEIPHPVPKTDGEAGNFFVCKNSKYKPELKDDELELNQIKANPNRPEIRGWQKKYPNNKKLQEESRKLLRMIDDAEIEIEEVLKISPKERKRTLLDLADKFSEWKDMYEIVMSLYDSAVDEAKQLNATSPLAKVQTSPVEKVGGITKVQSQQQKEENRKASSPENNFSNNDAASGIGEDKTANLTISEKEKEAGSPENQSARPADN